MRATAAVIAFAVLLGGCGGGGDDAAPTAGSETTATTSVPTTVAPGRAQGIGNPRVLGRALPAEDDVPGDFARRVDARPLDLEARPVLLWCGVDLRDEVGAKRGVQSIFASDSRQITVTVSGQPGSGAGDFFDRFTELGRNCDQPWEQPVDDSAASAIETEILQAAPVRGFDVDQARANAFIIRSTSDLGETVAVAAIVQAGPLTATITLSGPPQQDLDYANDVIVGVGEDLAALRDDILGPN